MFFYFVRHADPIYDPDSLTEQGKKQAECLAQRFCELNISEVYSSSSCRAIMTADPFCKKAGLCLTAFSWATEDKASRDFSVTIDGKLNWCFCFDQIMDMFNSEEVLNLKDKWYEYKDFASYGFKSGVERINREADAFFATLGFVHDREKRCYLVNDHNDKKIAFFAHGGFSMAFLSSILDIPYPVFCTHFEHAATSCVTIIHFSEKRETTIPKIVQYSDFSHLVRSGLKPYHSYDI